VVVTVMIAAAFVFHFTVAVIFPMSVALLVATCGVTV
jgi:hypothetical protein